MNAKQLLNLEKNYGNGYGSTLTDDEINNYNVDTDWYDQFFRTGTSQNHVLSLTSGSKNLSSFTSLGYYDMEGIVRTTDLKRFNFRNNLSGKSNDNKFNYATSLTINFSRNNQAASVGSGSVNYNPIFGANQGAPYLDPAWYTNGADLVNWYRNGVAPEGVGYNGKGTLGLSPYMLMDRNRTGAIRTDELKMIANIQASYKILEDLTLGTNIGMDYTDNVGLDYERPSSFTRILFQRDGEEFIGNQSDSYVRQFTFNMNTSLNYRKMFAEKHTLDASIFTEYYKGHQKTFGATQNGLDPKLYEPGNGAGYTPFNPDTPTFYVPDIYSGKTTAGLFSYFASVDYDYNERFGLSGTFRRDASFRFADTNKWGTFWSVSGRWNIDKESFMQGSPFDMLKLRGSYGTAGNQNIGGQSIFALPNASRTLYVSGTAYQNLPGYFVSQIGNPDLKWETIEQANIGLDFEVWKHRLRGNLDVYQKTTKDLYQSTPISAINGTYTINSNNGDMRNKGVEALISYDLFRTNDFLLTLTFNGSYNHNEMLNVPGAEGTTDLGAQVFVSGGQAYQYYLVKYAGVNTTNGNLLFYTKDGQLTENPDQVNDRRLTGKSPIPKYQGGFGFEANYKGFFATTQFNYVAGVYRFDTDLDVLQDPTDIGVFNKSTDLLNAWTVDNRNTDIPSLYLTNKGADGNSDRYLKDASYLRLRFASVGYQFPASMLDKTPFAGIKAFVQGENLVTWTKWRGWDAESPRGGDVYQYPTPRIISVGLELQF
jgi:TonB-linked SusC/RagA family outer membrane protein